MRSLLCLSLLGLVAYAITIIGVQSKVHFERVNISQPLGLHINLELEKSKDDNEMQLEYSEVKADINIDRSGRKNPFNLFKIKIVQDEDLFRCDNLTLVQPEHLDYIECADIDSAINNPESASSHGYIRGINYIRRQNFFLRVKSKRYPELNSAGETTFYRMSDAGVLNGIDAALDRHEQRKPDFGRLKLEIGYYVEARYQFDNSDKAHTCSGEIYFSLNRTALLNIGPDSTWPNYYSWLFYYTLEWHHGYILNINNFTCTHDNSDQRTLVADLLYVQKQEFPYRYLYHKFENIVGLRLHNNITQEKLDSMAHLVDKDPPPSIEKYSEKQFHHAAQSGPDTDFRAVFSREIFAIDRERLYETSHVVLFELGYFVSLTHNLSPAAEHQRSVEGSIAVNSFEDDKVDEKPFFVLKWYDDVFKNYDMKMSKGIMTHIQKISNFVERVGAKIAPILSRSTKHHNRHDEL